MGTRSYIALQIEEDEYLTIFCHYNGYPDDNGAILAEHYDKQEKVESLIQLGDLYFLRCRNARPQRSGERQIRLHQLVAA